MCKVSSTGLSPLPAAPMMESWEEIWRLSHMTSLRTRPRGVGPSRTLEEKLLSTSVLSTSHGEAPEPSSAESKNLMRAPASSSSLCFSLRASRKEGRELERPCERLGAECGLGF